MEDRHTFSEPRPASDYDPFSDALPEWHVDVYRKGVAEPIDTLVIDDTTLPPRRNKKGRVIWRLPSEGDRLPNFGTDERRRLVELFKERKKERKKSAKKGTMSAAAGAAASEESGGGVSGSAPTSVASYPPSREDNSIPAVVGRQKSAGRRKGKKRSDSLGKDDVLAPTPAGGKSTAVRDKRKEQQDSGKTTDMTVGVRPPGFRPSPPTSGNFNSEVEGLAENLSGASLASESSGLAEGPGAPVSRLMQHKRPSFRTPPPPPPAPPDAEYIIVPETDRPDPSTTPSPLPANPSMAVAAAKAFVDLYYPLLSHGLCDNLARHYTPRAQKSVSVGGAHAVVTGRDDIALQIAGLAGSAFVVRGVVAQDAHDGRGAHILVTGAVQTPSPAGEMGVATPFAHSVSLVPATAQGFDETVGGIGAVAPFAFQIHNDALSLLGSDMLLASPTVGAGDPSVARQQELSQTPLQQSQQGQPLQQVRQNSPCPVRPPGLFG
uniref:NTF2 domain-containing protein n=1 Tax=Odontella aurita TaxID=265563 RepID=A0A7S4HJ16_9STRA|mmetsp:Transcript_10707/g.31684  ORF Transcript_10707/g.31684 Transcript_10707/m.31684 type:complete len:491 (+) Transcript_10707:717-2189(+)